MVDGMDAITRSANRSLRPFLIALVAAVLLNLGLRGLDANRVIATTTELLQPARPAKRPANSVLDNARMRKANLTMLDDYHIPLQRLVDVLTS